MAIGTTVKVGFDASAVRAGMGGLKGMFGSMASGFKGVGLAARNALGIGEMIGQVLSAPMELSNYAGDLVDFSLRTGVAIEDLVILEEALQLAGAGSKDTAQMLQMFSKNLYEATQEAGPARDALNKLGLFAGEFADMPLDQAFEKVGKAVGKLPKGFKGVEGILADLFGARRGMKMKAFFEDFDGGMKQARQNAGPFARDIGANAVALDEMAESASAWQYAWQSFMLQGLKTIPPLLDAGMKDLGFFDTSKHQEFWKKLGDSFVSGMKMLESGEFSGVAGDLLKSAGKLIGEGIKESLSSISPTDMIKAGAKSMFGGSSATGGKAEEIGIRIDQSNVLLKKLVEKKGGWQ